MTKPENDCDPPCYPNEEKEHYPVIRQDHVYEVILDVPQVGECRYEVRFAQQPGHSEQQSIYAFTLTITLPSGSSVTTDSIKERSKTPIRLRRISLDVVEQQKVKEEDDLARLMEQWIQSINKLLAEKTAAPDVKATWEDIVGMPPTIELEALLANITQTL